MKLTPREIRLHEPEDSDSKDVYINDLVELRPCVKSLPIILFIVDINSLKI
jgi:hypothetical protein